MDADARLKELQSGEPMLKEEVTEEDIAGVVSSWTGVPTARLMEGEMAKLAGLEAELHRRKAQSRKKARSARKARRSNRPRR